MKVDMGELRAESACCAGECPLVVVGKGKMLEGLSLKVSDCYQNSDKNGPIFVIEVTASNEPPTIIHALQGLLDYIGQSPPAGEAGYYEYQTALLLLQKAKQ